MLFHVYRDYYNTAKMQLISQGHGNAASKSSKFTCFKATKHRATHYHTQNYPK